MSVTLTLMATLVLARPSLPPLRPVGETLRNPRGEVVNLRGTNLGNWLLLEMWMLASSDPGVRDQWELEEVLTERFGEKAKDELMEEFRRNWITERDFQIIRSFNMNLIRLPINYRLLEDDRRPKQLKPNAWKWIDRAIDWAEQHGMYTILDMHGIQGGQSEMDHTGREKQNKVWTSPADQERAAWLWGEFAKRYRNRSAVVAYDLFNEPYGGTKPQQVALFEKLYAAVRKHDKDKLILAHGNWDGFDHYGDPAQKGWRNVGFQMHYYPGLFGGGAPTPETHARHFLAMKGVEEYQNKLNVPFLVGEFNAVLNSAGGGTMTARHFRTYESNGWMTTMWSYKVMSKDGGIGGGTWGMVTNTQPIFPINFRTARQNQIQAYFDSFKKQPLTINEELREFLVNPTKPLPPLPELPPRVTEAPADTRLPGWTSSDIGGARTGGLVGTPSAFTLYGGGEDIWGGVDQFRFLHQSVTGDFTLEVKTVGLKETDGFAKAGIMVRDDLAPDSPHGMLSIFPEGELQFAQRGAKGEATAGTPGTGVSFPVRMRAQRRGDAVTFSYKMDGESTWREIGTRRVTAANLLVGVVALSHDNGQLTEARYEDLRLTTP